MAMPLSWEDRPTTELREPFAEGRDDAQVQLLEGRGVAGGALQQAQLRVDGHDGVVGAVHVLHGSATGAEDHGLARLGHVGQQRDVFQVARGDLEGRHVQFGQEIHAGEVEGGGKHGDADLLRVGLELLVLAFAELERLTVLAVGRPVAVLVVVGLLVTGLGVKALVVSLLKLHRIRTALLGDLEHLHAGLQLALMIVADLRYCVTVGGVIYGFLVND